MNRRKLTKLKEIYFDTKSPAAYAGVDRVHKEIKKTFPTTTIDEVREFLQGQSTYTLYRPNIKRFQRLKTVPSGLNTDWQADLAMFDTLYKNNDGYKYLLVCIDVLSRKIYGAPVKSKSPHHVKEGFKKIFEKAKTRPLKIYTDRGLEFQAREMIKFFEDNDIIKLVVYTPETHAGVVERANKTIKLRLYRYFHKNKTHRWVDAIDKIINGINNSVNRTIGVKPNDVTYKNAQELRERVFGDAFESRRGPRFEEGDLVRMSKDKGVFGRSFHPSYTMEIFKIKTVKLSNPPHYKIQDLKGNDIKGVFYEQDLSKIKANETDQKGSGLTDQKGSGLTDLKRSGLKLTKQLWAKSE
jgi:transposase InsO family protein